MIRSVKVNCAGTRVSILASKVDEQGALQPDTRLFVYDSESDKVAEHDFGPSAYVSVLSGIGLVREFEPGKH